MEVSDLPVALKIGNVRGEGGVRILESLAGGKENAAELLREAGYPGLKYLDGGSRAAGDGTSNYVVFDDALIEILRKYGLLPPAVAGGVAASQSDAQAAP